MKELKKMNFPLRGIPMKKWLSAVLACILGSLAFFLVSATTEEKEVVLAPEAPPAIEKELPPVPPAESFLSVPLSITAAEAERLLGDALVNPLYNVKGQKLDESYGESAADVLVERTGPVAVSLEDGKARVTLPFRFESLVRWKGNILGISSSTKQEVFGGGRLRLEVKPSIDRDWNIRLVGSLAVEWKEKPAITILGQKVGIARFLSSLLEERSGDLLRRAEEELNRSARLKEHAREQWESLNSPIRLADSPRLTLSVRPLEVSMPPFTAKGGILSAHVALRCLLTVTSGVPEAASPPPPLPDLSSLPPGLDPGVLVNLDARISYKALEEFISGQRIPPLDLPGGGMVSVEKISLFGSGEKLVAAAEISGKAPFGTPLKGTVYLTGKPVYSKEDQVLCVEEVDFDEDSTRGLMKVASWIVRPLLAKEIGESLVFPLGELRQKTLASLGDAVRGRQVSDKVTMDGTVGSLDLERFSLTGDGLRLSFSLGGTVSLKYTGTKEGKN